MRHFMVCAGAYELGKAGGLGDGNGDVMGKGTVRKAERRERGSRGADAATGEVEGGEGAWVPVRDE